MRTFALLVALAAVGAQADVYKWVDEKGQTQYTETPPPAGAQKLNVPTGGPATALDAAPVPAGVVKGPDTGTPEARTKRCMFEKDQLRVLERGTAAYRDDKGQLVNLDAARTEAARKQVQDNIKTYCSPGKSPE
ncbi:MAG TPA: DUF4124 domain-containing protein [Usitatibacter sp.]|jgi:hypothetical protein|nr:DUF4124 domain-containing protein [Usitatibacter sp.]